MDDNDVKKNPISADISNDDPFAEMKKEMRTRFELLPKDMQDTIMDTNYQMSLFEIAKENKLTYEELGMLELETTMVLLGMTTPEDYRDELQVQLKKNDPEMDTLVAAVNEKVFTPIRTSLDKVFSAKKDPMEPLGIPQEQTQENITENERTVLEKTGVVLDQGEAKKEPLPEKELPKRENILMGIENPERATPPPRPSIMVDKLSGTTTSAPKTTDHSVTKPLTPPSQKPSDPYREPLE